MNIRHLSALTLAALACCQTPAQAQTSVTLYGNLDLGVDHISKGDGNTAGTIYAASPSMTNSVSMMRVSSSLSSQSVLGFKASEDLGQGYTGRMQLESLLIPDTGTLGEDGRLFGHLAYVALGTPYGEVRAGRQGTPMLTSFYITSVEQLGSTDIMGAGLVVNNTQIYQDNMLSYVLRSPTWIGQVSYSPNAGVPAKISAARAPYATDATGQIVGGASAGSESPDHRGRSAEAMVTYNTDTLKLTAVAHYNKFGAVLGQYSAATGTTTPLFNVEQYQSYLIGGKYIFPGSGTVIGASFHTGHYHESGDADPKINSYALGFHQPIGAFTVGAEWSLSEFTNFTKGKDTGLMLIGDYAMSKRTTLYARIGAVKDDRGTPTGTTLIPAAKVAGGPVTLLVPIGAAELPVFSGAGMNPDATTSIIGIGIRHSF